ncbi:MAG: hypothetical protein JW763_02855 [candidate division Zixibacteria bacterium]|nr:hypothetical protein [candidate division Zixibacteria bacterium]
MKYAGNLPFRLLFLIVAIVLPTGDAIASGDSTVIAYYHANIAVDLADHYLTNIAGSYSYTVASVYTKTDYRGEVQKVDSAVFSIRHDTVSGDSVIVIDSADVSENIPPQDLPWYFPVAERYRFYFYPNDTGAGTLAIGFDPDSADTDALPAGHMTFDRNTFRLRSLTLHYREYGDYQQYSLDYLFRPVDSILVPARLIINGTRGAFLGRKYSRQELTFSDYRFDR